MKLKDFKIMLPFMLAALVCVSCFREAGTVSDKERISLGLSYNPEYSAGTKSVLTAQGIECKLTSVLVAAYFSESGKLDKTFLCDGSDKLSLLKDTRYDLFFLANAESPSSVQIPECEKDMESLQYRIPSYGSINSNGIPACAKLESQSFTADSDIKVNLERLLCKINVHISHKGITGKTMNDSAIYRNVKLYIRNANAVLSPFAEGGSRALETSDLLDISDYDPDMTGSSSDFVFYVPENMQGQLLPFNLDPQKKNEEELLAAGADPAVATYVEFTGRLMPSAGGVGGSLLYRMYLGGDNVSDFNLERNRVYNLGMELVPDNLLYPNWKVSHGEDWSDSRVLRLLDSSGAVIPDNSGIAIRPGHPAVVKLFMNTDGGSANMFAKAVKCGYQTDENEDPLTRLNWSSNVVSADQSSLFLPDRLSEEGISVSMDSRNGVVKFSVSDESALVEGKEYELVFFLSPGRAYHTRRLKLTVLPECVLEGSPDYLYVGQKRKLNVLHSIGEYSVTVRSGASCIDIDSNDPSIIYGKKTGTVVLRLKSSRPVDDPDMDVSLKVERPYIYSIYQAIPVAAFLDGVPRDLEYYIRNNTTREELDKNDFDPERLARYIPATVRHEPNGDFDPEVFLDYNPYTMQLAVKKLYDTRYILDYCNENGFADRIRTTYEGYPEIVVDVYIRTPFATYNSSLGTYELTGLVDFNSGNSFTTMINMVAAKETARFEYSGKMNAEFEIGAPDPAVANSEFRLSFPFSEQEKYLGEDTGDRTVTAIIKNAISGEEISYDYKLSIKGRMGLALVLQPMGNYIRDAVVRLCWKDSWRKALNENGGRGTLAGVNSAGDINDYFSLQGAVKLNGATHTVGELWPSEPSVTYENLTLQDCLDFMSSHKIKISPRGDMRNSVDGKSYYISNNRNLTIEKNADSKGNCIWTGCFVPDSGGGCWVDCAL